MCTESTKIHKKGLSNKNFTHKVNVHRAKVLTKDSLFLVSQLTGIPGLWVYNAAVSP